MAESQNKTVSGDVNAKLAECEKINAAFKERIIALEKELQKKDTELTETKKRMLAMESDIAQAEKIKASRQKEAEEVDGLKSKSEETLTKAKGIIFEKMKIIKNQELQLDAMHQQSDSLKDVVRITKDLLEIRNLEVKQLENKMQCMEDKIRAEKERQDLMHKKLETMIRHNGELKREYEAQLILFQSLRKKYNERDIAQEVCDNLIKDQQMTNGDAGTSSMAEEAPKPEETKKEETEAPKKE
ncbi:unnamed protein product [Brassicogethes aeneus]|uniref:Uncharacterized protein n=1 Tax=Brassicogethes aeneus TaxID=1431903 RepID=A0A9P0FF58_BRAAE|nr:unnamed protein product [Brassicogethes aeneus]